jgi:hypothetical protein
VHETSTERADQHVIAFAPRHEDGENTPISGGHTNRTKAFLICCLGRIRANQRHAKKQVFDHLNQNTMVLTRPVIAFIPVKAVKIHRFSQGI